MKEIKSKFGTLYLDKEKQGGWLILDSDKYILCRFDTHQERTQELKNLNRCKHISEWLEQFDDVCWGTKQDIIDYTQDYAECNGREFDSQWLEDTYNRIGDTYIMFAYSDCYK